MKSTYLLAPILLAALPFIACGGDSEGSTGGGGTAAVGGTSGSSSGGASGSSSGGASGSSSGGTSGSSSGGASGSGGTSGSSSGGASGSGGTSGSSSGGASGSGGATGGTGGVAAAAECTQDTDCKVFNDCCNCEGIPKSENPASCKKLCIQNTCEALGVSPTTVSCVAGRCVKGFNCDTSEVKCKAAEPACPAGEVPQVSGSCYTFACVPANECTFVPSCTKCAAGDACANYVTQTGPRPHCVSIPKACGGDSSCGCLGPTVCIKPFNSCNNLSGLKGVTCGCPVC